MKRRVALLAAAAGCAGALAGCGPEPAPSATAPPAPTGAHFAGFDEASRAVRRALAAAGQEAHVAIASLVNEGGEPVPVPRFAAVDRLGERHGLPTAARARGGLPGAEARRARDLLDEPATVPAGGSALVYLVLRGASPGDLRELRMRAPSGRAADLERRGT